MANEQNSNVPQLKEGLQPPKTNGGSKQGDLTAPPERIVSDAEVLMGENYMLRVQNLSLQKQLKEMEVKKLELAIGRAQQEMMLFRKKLAEKYNIDFSREEIDGDTGKVIPANTKK